MRGPRFTKAQREQQKAEIASLLTQKVSTWDIASRLGISHGQTMYLKKKIEDEWRWMYQQAIEERITSELAVIDAVEREAWAAWFRSLGNLVREETFRREEDDDFDRARAQDALLASVTPRAIPVKLAFKRTTEDRGGNYQYLGIILKCTEMRSKLLRYDRAPAVPQDIREVAQELSQKTGYPFDQCLEACQLVAKDESDHACILRHGAS